MEWTILVAYVAIIAMALLPIWIGAHLSLEQKVVETMKAKDAYMFPIIGSCVLFGLYVLFKLFSKEYINLLLTLYFLFFGVMAVSATIRPLVLPFFPKAMRDREPSSFTIWGTEFKWTEVDLAAFVLGSLIALWYGITKHWVANNILGLSFSIQGIALISLGSFQTGCILLGGLFLYDIFWVFGTDVMVTVAKSFDAPVKLLWPKDLLASELQFSMLGLGDIVIPGIFIALMLRFDLSRARKLKNKKNFPKPYFTFTFTGYVLGMLATIAVMHFFQAAQPALLYLVPFCIGSSLLAALLLSEVRELLFFTEGDASDPSGNKAGSKGAKGNKGNSQQKKTKSKTEGTTSTQQ